MKIAVPVSSNFNLVSTIYSHGWSGLPPFRVYKDEPKLGLALAITPKKFARLEITQRDSKLIINSASNKTLDANDRHHIVSTVRSCLRLDDDVSQFYAEVKKLPRYRWIPKKGAGRLLRAPTVFEDVVKMICTTNCSWALTEIMVKNLCSKLGEKVSGDSSLFPTPDVIADCSEKFLRKEIRAGYRSPYLLELSRRIVKNDLRPESWRQSAALTEELFEEVRAVKGIGPYAAGNILKLLGRYDYLGIDSWCRKKFFEIHKNGRKTSDKVIETFYAPFGKWRGLLFWLDVTKDWYNEKFPF